MSISPEGPGEDGQEGEELKTAYQHKEHHCYLGNVIEMSIIAHISRGPQAGADACHARCAGSGGLYDGDARQLHDYIASCKYDKVEQDKYRHLVCIPLRDDSPVQPDGNLSLIHISEPTRPY